MWILCGFCLGGFGLRFGVFLVVGFGLVFLAFVCLFCCVFGCLFLRSGTGVSFSTWQGKVIYDPVHSFLHPWATQSIHCKQLVNSSYQCKGKVICNRKARTIWLKY